MKKILLSIIISSAIFAGNFSADISLIGQIPKGELKEEGVPTGFGLDLNGLWYPVEALGFGLNLGATQYGSSNRSIPFNGFTDLVNINEKTTNNIGYGHFLLRFYPFKSNIKPYIEGLLGIKNLNTTTSVYSELSTQNCGDNAGNCEIASSTNASDNAISYGVGGGMLITITSINKNERDFEGILSFNINIRYLLGENATYLEEGAITFSDSFPVETSFNWSESKTDLLQIGLGLRFDFEL